jgi:hypothetical protein
MATEELQPVAAENTVATPTSVAPAMNAEPLLPTLNASAVYAPSNVQQVLTKSSKTYKKMKLSKLEQQIAKANSQAELNQINIENTPVAMGVISGQASQQSKLDTARLNAVTGLYNAKLLDQQRKEAERQQFISTYGADPNQRPKGMSKREFSKAIQGGGFQNLLTEDFKQKQLQTAAAQKSLSGGSDSGSNNLQAEIMSLRDSGVSWGDAAAIISKKYGMMPGDQTSQIMDYVYGNIQPSAPLTVAQQQAQIEAQADQQKAQKNATNALEKVALLENHPALKTSVGVKGVTGGLLGGWVMPGTKAADFNAQLDSLKSMLTIENLGIMKGVLSDADIKILREAATSINKNMSEADFNAELARIKTILNSKASKSDNDPLGLGI